jgi:long-chain acyl-CoA synthetase
MFDAYALPWRNRGEVLKPGGWFGTGDIARIDAQGYVHLVGRNSSCINVGGMKFFPEEVESVLCSHPDIQEARVFGNPHPNFGTVPVAEIVRSADSHITSAELSSFCRKRLARYKLPAEYRFCESLPKTASGKIKRF